MRRVASMLFAGLMTGLVLAGTTSAPAVGGSGAFNGRILFTRCTARGCDIYTANPDGSAIRRVTHDGNAFSGDWSPDGRHIAYVGAASGDFAIWIVRSDGSHARQLTPNDRRSDNFWPRFAPNGRRLLFVNCGGSDCDGGIGSVRTDGTHLHMVTENSHSSYNVAELSPDGTRLAYMRWHVDGVKMAIYVANADGTDERRITQARLEGYLPDWSPSGDRITFTSYVFFDRPAPSLYSVRPDGSDVQALTHPPSPHSDWDGSYSPDGSKIIFDSDRRYVDGCCGDLFTIDAGGGNLQRIDLPFDAYDPRWGTAPPMPITPMSISAHDPVSRAPIVGGSPCDVVPGLVDSPMCPEAG
jgi:Tol biopolymer transport system component